jgi:hypothetical protein
MAKKFALHGWFGLGLMLISWLLNWGLPGLRTQLLFFPLWLGYCLIVDALVLHRSGTSLLTRSRIGYIGVFMASAPIWWLFELANQRLKNWHYVGAESFSPFWFGVLATINFTTVIPAVFGTAELMRSFLNKPIKGPVIRPTKAITIGFFIAGWILLGLMITWPVYFFPVVWVSLFFILEPANIWLGHRSLLDWVQKGNWQPIASLWLGVLVTAFFWEMWNFYSYPKWVYQIPWGNGFHIFEMPLLGYGGYLPFALELFSMYHLLVGLTGRKKNRYVMELPDA